MVPYRSIWNHKILKTTKQMNTADFLPRYEAFQGSLIKIRRRTLLSLEKYIFYLIFGDYLVMSDIMNFESALNNDIERVLFLKQLNGCPILVDYNISKKMNQFQIMDWILQKSVRYKSLNISQWNSLYLTSGVLNYFTKSETNMQMKSLTIDYNIPKSTSFEEIFSLNCFKQYCSSLVELKEIRFCDSLNQWKKFKEGDQLNNYDPILQIVVQCCSRLEEVSLIRGNVSVFSLNLVAEFCPNLRLLSLNQCISLDDSPSFTTNSFVCLAGLLHLVQIDLSCTHVESEAITYILQNCYNLEDLFINKISKWKRLGLNCFANVERKTLKLSLLNLSQNLIEGDDVCALFKKTPNLTEFIASSFYFSDKMAKILSKKCINLTNLNISMNTFNLTEESFVLLFKRCIKLKFIFVNGSEINDTSLCAISQNCIDLKGISMMSCLHISDSGVKTIFNDCLNLEKIMINSCKYLTNEIFNNINRNLTKLKFIDFRNCIMFTEQGLLSLINRCPRNLQFFWCDKKYLTDTVVNEMKTKFIREPEKLIPRR